MSWRKVFLCGALAIAVVSQGDDAFGARRAKRCSSGSSCSASSCSDTHVTKKYYVEVATCYAKMQVRGIYFDCFSSAWYESDALVPIDCAKCGVLAEVKIPGCIHKVKLWITEVYKTPKLTPPSFNCESGGESSAQPGA